MTVIIAVSVYTYRTHTVCTRLGCRNCRVWPNLRGVPEFVHVSSLAFSALLAVANDATRANS
jgi:hypothetical protein